MFGVILLQHHLLLHIFTFTKLLVDIGAKCDVGRNMANMGPAAGALCLLAIFSVSLAEEACQSFGGGNVYQEPNRAGGHVLHYSKTISKYAFHVGEARTI